MRAWPLHVVFATLLVGSLAAKERAADVLVEIDNPNFEAAVTRVARSHDLTFLEEVNVSGNIRGLTFAAPGCPRPVLVILRITLDYEPAFEPLRERGDDLRYVYLDRSWDKPDRLGVFVQRMKYAALATLGLTRYVPSAYMLVVDSPPGCQAVDAIDWREVWNRDYLADAAKTR